jgi:hypothetical protein
VSGTRGQLQGRRLADAKEISCSIVKTLRNSHERGNADMRSQRNMGPFKPGRSRRFCQNPFFLDKTKSIIKTQHMLKGSALASPASAKQRRTVSKAGGSEPLDSADLKSKKTMHNPFEVYTRNASATTHPTLRVEAASAGASRSRAAATGDQCLRASR